MRVFSRCVEGAARGCCCLWCGRSSLMMPVCTSIVPLPKPLGLSTTHANLRHERTTRNTAGSSLSQASYRAPSSSARRSEASPPFWAAKSASATSEGRATWRRISVSYIHTAAGMNSLAAEIEAFRGACKTGEDLHISIVLYQDVVLRSSPRPARLALVSPFLPLSLHSCRVCPFVRPCPCLTLDAALLGVGVNAMRCVWFAAVGAQTLGAP